MLRIRKRGLSGRVTDKQRELCFVRVKLGGAMPSGLAEGRDAGMGGLVNG